MRRGPSSLRGCPIGGTSPFSASMRSIPCRRKRSAPASMPLPEQRRPAWLNWLILLAFLWSSWQLAGFWLERLHG